MLTVHIAENPLAPETWEQLEAENLCELLIDRFGQWPATGRIYHQQVADSCDVTPCDEAGVKRLLTLTGTVYVVIYPGDPLTDALIAAAIGLALNFAVSIIFPPEVPQAAGRNRNMRSPNNALSGRTNQARIGGRIPDIFGKVWSVPDALAFPYTIFRENKEIEISYMCIGRGTYAIYEAEDGETPVSTIADSSVEVYAPYSSPNSGHAPIYSIGDPIETPVLSVRRSNSANGQILRAPNEYYINGASNISFGFPDYIYCDDSDVDFTEKFEEGETLIVSSAETIVAVGGGSVTVDFAGTYTIATVTASTITLENPAAINTDWEMLEDAGETDPISPHLNTDAERWTDYIYLDDPGLRRVYANIVASNGLWKDDGSNQYKVDVDVTMEVTPVGSDNVPTGAAETFAATVFGSSTDRQMKGITIKAAVSFTGRCRVRLRRTSDTDLLFAGSVVDEVQLRDLYAVTPDKNEHYGNVTTVMWQTYGTLSALAVKERKARFLVERKLPRRITGSTFTRELWATSNAADIISAVCLDQYIGGRSVDEVDFDDIYAKVDEVDDYFGTELAAQFCYTFDEELSFEETLATICPAIFSTAYRRGNLIKLWFERATDDSSLLFNHRNKLPKTEARTITFGPAGDNDGIEFEWVDPEDDAIVTIYLPENQTARKPRRVEGIGVRNAVQAHLLAHRAYQKLLHQHEVCEFEATAEAEMLVASERILVADNTRPDTMDGEVLSQSGLSLYLSQPCDMDAATAYTIFLQLIDGTTDAITCTPGADNRHVAIARAPRLPLATADDLCARTTYCIVSASNAAVLPYMVNEVTPKEGMTCAVNCTNYDDRYYLHDADYINGIITE